MSTLDHQKIVSVLRECAQRFVLPRYKSLAAHEISAKSSPTDLVTAADKDVEAALSHILPGILHGSIVVGEEGVSSGSSSLDLLNDSERDIWVVDPVDGTYNFVHGNKEFCIMLALVRSGRTNAGWIYDPLSDNIMIVERGSGATINDQRISVAASKSLSDLEGYVGMKYFPKEYRPHIKERSAQIAKLSTLSCAGHEYLKLASGRKDFALYTKVKPWDHLAGTLMLEEAGGYSRKWDATPYTPQDKSGGILAASGPEVWKNVHDLFLGKAYEEFRLHRAGGHGGPNGRTPG